MNGLLERFTGMHTLTDKVIAMDYLISIKSGVKNCAMAVTNAGTPEVKAVLTLHLEEMLDLHERIMVFMMEKGWYQPWDVKEQLTMDMENAEIALKAPML